MAAALAKGFNFKALYSNILVFTFMPILRMHARRTAHFIGNYLNPIKTAMQLLSMERGKWASLSILKRVANEIEKDPAYVATHSEAVSALLLKLAKNGSLNCDHIEEVAQGALDKLNVIEEYLAGQLKYTVDSN